MSKEHLDKLLEGVDAWNQWRAEHPEITPSLSDLDVTKIGREKLGPNAPWFCSVHDGEEQECLDLSHYDLSSADLHGANLQEARLINVFMPAANLQESHFDRANLSYAFFPDANVSGASFNKATLERAFMANVAAERKVSFREAQASEARLFGCSFSGSDFQDAILVDADLDYSNCAACSFEDADLRGASIFGTIFVGSKLRGAILRNVRYDRRELVRGVAEKWDDVSGLHTVDADAALKSILLDHEFISGRLREFSSEWPKFDERIRTYHYEGTLARGRAGRDFSPGSAPYANNQSSSCSSKFLCKSRGHILTCMCC